MVRRRQSRHDRQPDQLLASRSSVAQIAKDKNRIAIVNGSGSSRLTGDGCTPNSIHYAYDTYALAKGTGSALMKAGRNELVLPDRRLRVRTCARGRHHRGRQVAWRPGRRVRCAIRSRPSTSRRSCCRRRRSKAKVVALAGSGTVFVNAVKSAQEFGIRQGGQTLAGLLVWITDIKELGLQTAQGLVLTNAFYWDRDDETRAWSKRFYERMKRMPHMGDAGDYSSTMHYLKAIEAAGTDEAKAVMAKMREMPINDFFAKGGRIREDGRMVHDMYVYEVKKPSESKGDWDYYKLREVIPRDQAFRPLSESPARS